MPRGGFLLQEELGYFQHQGVDVIAFDDIYPEGHQSGVSILMHGQRVAACGDLRLEPTPGQFQPVPERKERALDADANVIATRLVYPAADGLAYTVRVEGREQDVIVSVDLEQPLPAALAGRLCFRLELFPGDLFGQPWRMDDRHGIFPPQPNGPTLARPGAAVRRPYAPEAADDLIALPYAVGRKCTIRPDDPARRLTIESKTADLTLYDGRMNHNNGWFVVSSEVPAGRTKAAIEWVVTPHVIDGWRYPPVVQVSQVGYHPDQPKIAVIELDRREREFLTPRLCRLDEGGETTVFSAPAEAWGLFLRYRYLRFDFSAVREEGLYRVRYGDSATPWFRVARDVYDRGVWQPVLEYFLPIQMCHMRVSEKYRVWHGLCHNDDARMAPLNHEHFDGYRQGPETYAPYKPGDVVPGLNVGGWHDAGDFDLRIESQAGECCLLAHIFEEFGVDLDETSVDQTARTVEIHQPDGKNDLLQQLEHGLLSVLGAYRALGRPYRGIICNSLRQYVLLGDPVNMTDGVPGNDDDRWVFTEHLPWRDLQTAAQLAASARALRGFNDTLSGEALHAAVDLYDRTEVTDDRTRGAKLHAAAELFLSTGGEAYRARLLDEAAYIAEHMGGLGWIACRVVHALDDARFTATLRDAAIGLKARYDALRRETPYGVPYRPHVWGAGWDVQRQGYQYYFLHKAFPDIFSPDFLFRALDFVLGCHPGANTASFASGVGARSATVAYGFNRADWSYIPGGVISGTALIRPDFPELLDFPFLWQQTEYVMGGGSTHFMFLTLAVKKLLDGGRRP